MNGMERIHGEWFVDGQFELLADMVRLERCGGVY